MGLVGNAVCVLSVCVVSDKYIICLCGMMKIGRTTINGPVMIIV